MRTPAQPVEPGLAGDSISLGAAASRTWDAIVVGAGHNGLTAAAYLARAGRSVLVLERSERLGGACTLERPFSDQRFVISPCAYLVGLLHPLVISELDLPRHGYRTVAAEPSTWCPFPDGSSLADHHDEDRTTAEVARLSPRDVDGWRAYWDVFTRLRRALREGERDTWVGEAPSLDEVLDLLGEDGEARAVVEGMPIADLVESHVRDERLRTALHGGGIIGTFAGPRDPGTAWVRALHQLGTLGGWSYVIGGMGNVSAAIAAATRAAGATLVTGSAVAAIEPGAGVELEDGTSLRARAVVSNADPHRTAALLGEAAPKPLRERVASWRSESPVLKLNCALSRLPDFPAAAGRQDVHRAQVTIATSIDDTQRACEAARGGEPSPGWAELYFQSACDASVAPPGAHSMSVFCQYVPYRLADGSWESRRDEVAQAVLDLIARFAPDVTSCVEEVQVLAPPDVEARIGLTGGHIFQGECLPEQMWERRFAARTGADGIFMCGAGTHPAGSVIAINGRNAAMAVLADLSA